MNAVMDVLIAFLNSLWQAVLLAGLVWLALRSAPRMNAATRFAIWWAVLGAVLILPATPSVIAWARERLKPVPSPYVRQPYVASPTPVLQTELAPLVTLEERNGTRWPLWLAAAWGLIFLYRLARLIRSYLYLRALKHSASVSNEPLPATGRSAILLLSGDIDSPIAVGFARPAVVLPNSLPAQLSREEIDYVLLHETAHLARWDDWTNLLARILEAALVLHPVAFWILRRIGIEREAACDDWVVAHTPSVRTYAQSLAKLYEMRLSHKRAVQEELLAAGMFGSGTRLSKRIETLLRRGREFSGRVSAPRVSASCAGLLALAAVASFSPRWIAFAQQPSEKTDLPQFEVASIRPSNPEQGFINAVTPSLNMSGDRNLRFVQITLRDLIMLAYGVGAPQIQGPRFLNGTPESPADRFDIVGQAPEGTTREQVPLMLRGLLAERFHLSFHRENKLMQIYALERDKGAPKMKESPEGAMGPGRCVRSFAEHEGATLAAECTHMTSADIAQQVMALAPGYFRDGPVVDLSGLKGAYDFKLQWVTRVEANNGSSGPTMIDAIQEQLGLKLERRRQSMQVLVIDTLDRKPTEN